MFIRENQERNLLRIHQIQIQEILADIKNQDSIREISSCEEKISTSTKLFPIKTGMIAFDQSEFKEHFELNRF